MPSTLWLIMCSGCIDFGDFHLNSSTTSTADLERYPRSSVFVNIELLLVQIDLNYVLLYLLRLHVPFNRFDELSHSLGVKLEREQSVRLHKLVNLANELLDVFVANARVPLIIQEGVEVSVEVQTH